MDIAVSFPGGKRVDAQMGDFVVRTDQPKALGGDESAVAPYDLFLAAIATCAGIYVLGFCQARGLATDGIALKQHVEFDPDTKLARHVKLDLELPPSFPEKYRAAVARAAEGCKVKKTLASPPTIEVVTHQELDQQGAAHVSPSHV